MPIFSMRKIIGTRFKCFRTEWTTIKNLISMPCSMFLELKILKYLKKYNQIYIKIHENYYLLLIELTVNSNFLRNCLLQTEHSNSFVFK